MIPRRRFLGAMLAAALTPAAIAVAAPRPRFTVICPPSVGKTQLWFVEETCFGTLPVGPSYDVVFIDERDPLPRSGARSPASRSAPPVVSVARPPSVSANPRFPRRFLRRVRRRSA